MPVLLDTPFDPGDLDPGHTYPRANITMQDIRPEMKRIQVEYEYGDMVEGIWTKGAASPTKYVVISGTDYDDLIILPTNAGEDHKIYLGAKRVLYSYLIGKGILSGEVE